MALPVVNETLKYTLKIPSTGQTIEYRPFLVKEQKILLLALESEDEGMVVRAMRDTISACVLSDVDVGSLSTFDSEYIFTQIRCKSAGETTEIGILCVECETQNDMIVNLSDITIDDVPTPPTIQLNTEYFIKLRYPTYMQMIEVSQRKEDNTFAEMIFDTCIASLDCLQNDDNQFHFDEEPYEEKVRFLDGLNSDQFKNIMDFVQGIPKMKKTIEFDCSSCGHKNKQTLEGINDFFQ